MASYGDRVGPLTLDRPLRASGKVVLRRGVSDSTTLFGFYHSERSLAVNPSQGSGFPEGFLGVAVEGPSREGFFVYPVYRMAGDGRATPGARPAAHPARRHAPRLVPGVRPGRRERPGADRADPRRALRHARPPAGRPDSRRHVRPLRPRDDLDRRQRAVDLFRRPVLYRLTGGRWRLNEMRLFAPSALDAGSGAISMS